MSDAETRLALRMLAGSILSRFRIVFSNADVDYEVSQENPMPVAIVSGAAGGGAGDASAANQVTQLARQGTAADAAVTDPAAAATQIAAAKGLLALAGSTTEAAPATDTASSGLNGRLQRIAQRLTTIIGLIPLSLGAKAAAASFAVTNSTEDAAAIGTLTEAAPATDTASSGLNGRLQRIAQRLTTIIGLLPNALANGRLKIALRDAADADLGTIANPLYTSPVGATVTLVDRSGTIAVGGTQQQLVAANATRRGLWVQNNSTGDLRINSTGNASANSGIILPGGQNALYEYPSSGVPVTAISIWGATGGQAFEAREW